MAPDPIIATELIESRALRFGTDRNFLTRVWKVYRADVTQELTISEAIGAIKDGDAPDDVLVEPGAPAPTPLTAFIAIEEPEIDPAPDRAYTYLVKWTYIDTDPGPENEIWYHSETQGTFIDTYRVGGDLATEDQLYIPSTPALRSYPPVTDISGLPVSYSDSPGSWPITQVRIVQSRMIFRSLITAHPLQWSEYIGTRNAIAFYPESADAGADKFEPGTCLYLGPVINRFSRDVERLTHRILYDPLYHMRQHAVKHANGRVQTTSKTVTLAEGGTRGPFNFTAKTVYWVQPFPRETDWPAHLDPTGAGTYDP